MVRHKIQKLLWKLGVDVCAFNPDANATFRGMKILKKFDIDLVLDVGANTGGFARKMRDKLGFKGRIISFEPLGGAFAVLKARAADDQNWCAMNYALGSYDGDAEIHVAQNSVSSSILPMLSAHIDNAPNSKYTGKEKIIVKKLDTIFGSLSGANDNIYLKIDTQGFEKSVLSGAAKVLEFIDTIEMEMSLSPLYVGGATFEELYSFVYNLGYRMISVEPVFVDQISGQVLQVDAVFHRFA